jgi:predicted DNA-binding ribbon-helix-helix protein
MTRRPELSFQRTKRSIVIAEHKTSVAVEEAFWLSLKEIAAEEGVPLPIRRMPRLS